ncbi:MAG: hypothetical protein KF809_15330 [Chloroflexi bacterium]|nr:hypothetical protein [Chloroflexota bacterium]
MADREPMGDLPRLEHMRPASPPAAEHASHDRWLVVRAATDPADLTPDETVEARRLLRDCIECTTLASDLGIISHAMATLPVPARPRDFRITPEQAASARGSLLTRLGRWIAAPRQAVLRPVAGAALAMGLVLVVVSPMVPSQGDPSGPQGMRTNVVAPKTSDDAPQATDGVMSVMMSQDPDTLDGGRYGDARPQASPGGHEAQGVGGPEVGTGQTSNGRELVGPDGPVRVSDTTASASPTDATIAMLPAPTDAPTSQPPAAREPEMARAASGPAGLDDTSYALLLLGIVLAGSGGIVLLLVWFGRRAEDPLLR